jgi:hypothetical protein
MRKFIFLLAALALPLLADDAEAQLFRGRRSSCASGSYCASTATTVQTTATQTTATTTTEATCALDEVNAARARRGLKPFLKCDLLTVGAINVAIFRAARRIEGHTGNDFAGLPEGTPAHAAGCAAWPVGSGWGACCTYDVEYTYAGAASAVGPDGRRYMHLFVRR